MDLHELALEAKAIVESRTRRKRRRWDEMTRVTNSHHDDDNDNDGDSSSDAAAAAAAIVVDNEDDHTTTWNMDDYEYVNDNDSENDNDDDDTSSLTGEQQQNHDRSLQQVASFTRQGVLSSLPELDEIVYDIHLNEPENVTSRNNRVVDEYDVTGSYLSGSSSEGLFGQFPIMYTCHLIQMLALSPFPTQLSTYEDLAAVALALEHLNTGNGWIVPQLDGLNEVCPVRFSLELLDTRGSAGSTVDGVSEITSRKPSRIEVDEVTGEEMLISQSCAFLGAASSSITTPAALLTGHKLQTQVSGASTSNELDDKEQYPFFGRTIPNDSANALTIVEYFRDVVPIQYIALLTSNDSYGISFGSAFQSIANQYAKQLNVVRFTLNDNDNDIDRALNDIKASSFRYILAVMSGTDLHNQVMARAYQIGIAGNGLYAWFFPDGFEDVLQDKAYKPESALAQAYSGVGMFLAGGSISGGEINPTYDRFLAAMAEIRNPTDLVYLQSLIPEEQTDAPTEVPLEPLDDELETNVTRTESNFTPPQRVYFDDEFLVQRGYYFSRDDFLDPVRNERTAFTYDATVLLGLAACDALERTNGSFTGTRHFNRMRTIKFDGVTGRVQVDSDTASRLPNSTLYRLVNYVPEEVLIQDEINGTITTTKIVVFDKKSSQLYDQGNWSELTPFIYNDGTTTPPADLPPVDVNYNYIDPVIRGIAFTFYALCVVSAIAMIAWTWKYRKSRIVKASQPFFLYLLCLGVIILASFIVTSVFDTSFASLQACSRACTAGVWMLSVGLNLIFSALFTKTYRINKIMKSAKKFRKVRVTVRQTLLPMTILLLLNVLILSLMTVLSPPAHVRTELTLDGFGRVSSSFGHCSYTEQGEYLIAILILNIGILLLSIYQAYQARHLSTEFSESKYIFKALMTMMLALFVGMPVIALSYETPSAVAFISSALITIVCMTVLLYIFLPKIRFIFKEQNREGLSPTAAIMAGVSGFRMPVKNDSDATHPNVDSHHRVSDSGPMSKRDSTSTEFGDRIVTTKTAGQLAIIIHQLEREIGEKDRLLKEWEEKWSAGGNANVETSPEAANSSAYQENQTTDDPTKQSCDSIGNVDLIENGNNDNNDVPTPLVLP